jgi:hypothetical protein
MNIATNMPEPARAIKLGSWEQETGTYEWFRRFVGTCRVVELPDNNRDRDIYVRVEGEQDGDGRIDRWISLEETDVPLDAGQAKKLARHLLAAADEISDAAEHDTI